MDQRHDDQQRRQQLLTIVDRGNAEQLFVSSFCFSLNQKNKKFLKCFYFRLFYNNTIEDRFEVLLKLLHMMELLMIKLILLIVQEQDIM
jgi:hypothetical protein